MSDQFSNDELQALWDTQPADLTINNMKELTVTLRQEHRREQKRLLFLNLQEVIPATGLFLWLGWKGLQANANAWAWFGAALIALGVGIFLIASSLRQRRVEQTFDATTRGELQRSLSQMQHRSKLYRTVAWWYLLPAAAAIVLILIAENVSLTAPFTLGYLAVAAAGLAGLYYWNRKIGREKYDTQVERFSRLIADLAN